MTISELGERHVERMREGIDGFECGSLSIGRLIAHLEALVGMLLDEADPEWVGELEAECNRLEFVHAAGLTEQRGMSASEINEVRDAVLQLRLMLTLY